MTNSDNLQGDSDRKKIGESNSNSLPDGSKEIVPAADSNEAVPVIPITAASPDRAVLSIMENPTVLEALVHEAPEEVIKFVAAADERQFKFYTQREENRHKEQLARENTTRIAIGTIGGAVLAAFGYSALTGDISLSAEIISVIVGGFGGLGISKLLTPPED